MRSRFFRRSPRVLRLAPVVAVAAMVSVACTEGEEPVPVDLDATTTTTQASSATTATEGTLPEDDPNAEARQMVIDAAEQQCLDDPELAEGVVRIVDPETDQVLNEYVADCDEVRGRADG